MTLADFLRREAETPFQPGRCALIIADWVWAQRGFDPAPHLRGPYASREEAEAAFAECGLARLVGRAARLAGLRLTREPSAGAIALVGLPGRLCCAIRTERFWAMRPDGPVEFVRADLPRLVAAWSV